MRGRRGRACTRDYTGDASPNGSAYSCSCGRDQSAICCRPRWYTSSKYTRWHRYKERERRRCSVWRSTELGGDKSFSRSQPETHIQANRWHTAYRTVSFQNSISSSECARAHPNEWHSGDGMFAVSGGHYYVQAQSFFDVCRSLRGRSETVGPLTPSSDKEGGAVFMGCRACGPCTGKIAEVCDVNDFTFPQAEAAKPPVEGFVLVDGRGACSYPAPHYNFASQAKTLSKGHGYHLERDV